MPQQNSDLLVVGRFGSPYGIKGWINFRSFTSPPENLLDYRPWFLADKPDAPLQVVQARVHQKGFVAQIDGVAQREQAEELKNLYIGVPRSVLPKAGPSEIYWQDLIGSTVRTSAGDLGKVTEMLETGVHDVMVVRRPSGEDCLIPYVAPYVLASDHENLVIDVDWDPDW